ncbi:MAG: molybdopterin-dependent oxidoreductase, partial [Eggerthellaceae bacterium]|nr:molybdopterin-dependent oxidoreductase [Eggerthellaceae bacterium]
MATLSRRSFVKWTSAVAGAAALSGFAETAFADGQAYDADVDAAKQGEWKVVPCYNNCSCDSSRCLLKCYFEDGVPIKIRSDEEGDDSIEMPQRRACLRGRAAIKDKLSPMRVKYPMKRKSWSPDDPHGELRGIDEWERISWDEALDYVAAEIQKCLDKYGPHSMLSCTEMSLRNCTWDAVYSLFNYVGAMTNVHGEISWGAWNAPTSYMTGAENNLAAPDALTFSKTKLHIMFGNNWAVNKSGLAPYQMQYAKDQGAKMIFIDPWFNRTAQAFADEWIPVLPGTDGALALGLAYHQIENGLYDQDYLDKYCIGFDAGHMPEGADAKDNFKDYVLGTYDGEPKSPEWAEAICGVPAAKIRELAELIAGEEDVGFFGGMSTTKHPAGEQFAQAMYTLAFMHGTVGREGSYVSWQGLCDSGISSMASEGACMGGADVYPDKPEPEPQHYPNRVNSCIDVRNPGNVDWAMLDMSTQWQEILDGE